MIIKLILISFLFLLYPSHHFLYNHIFQFQTNKGSGRVSSKQVGEELFASNKNSFKSGTGGKFAVNCDANDMNQVWPLLCYELGVSVDQEERFMQSFRRSVI